MTEKQTQTRAMVLQGVPQSNLDEIEEVLEDINQKYIQ